jgi:ubiquinone/menaquinone biosynthesis C-methylase UbiE
VRIDYDEELYKTYHEARAFLPETAQSWVRAVSPYIDRVKRPTILDLGSGTGRFSTLLADAFDARVIGVEPAAKMKAIAEAESAHPRVRYLGGEGERIPLGDLSCDYAWLSMVVHHLRDTGKAAQELYRVLKPGGIVFIRNSFSGRLGDIPCYRFFPPALEADTARLPTAEAVQAALQSCGFEFLALKSVPQIIDRNLSEHLARLRKRGVSTFELISDEDFEAGLRRMDQAAREGELAGPVRESIDLLVLAKRS